MEFTGSKANGTSRQSKPIIERRGSQRLVVHSPAYVRLNGSSPDRAPDLNEILDISDEGVSVQTSSPLEVNSDLNLSLDLSETNTRINTTGQVVWSNHSGRAGIRFPKLSDQSLRQLKEWLFVNILTAFDHARGKGTTSDYPHVVDQPSNGSFLLHNDPQEVTKQAVTKDVGSEMPTRPTGRETNGQANAVQRELTAGGYVGDAALQLIAERTLTLTRATGAAIALAQDDAMLCRASAGSDAPPVGSRLRAASGFSGECIRTGRCLRCDDSETDDRVDRNSCRALGVRSIVAVPIRPGSRVTGLLEVFSSQPFAFSPEDISVLRQLSGTIVSVIGDGAAVSVASPSRREATPAVLEAPRVEPRVAPRIEEKAPSAVMPATMAAANVSPRLGFHKILLAAAAVTFALALLWLVAPWFSSGIRQARGGHQAKDPQTAASKPRTVPAETSDLTGLRKLAEQGDAAAQFALGARYATGEEVKQDYSEAVRWFALAADQGHVLAQATLGAYYWAGRGVPPDMSKAYFWSALAQAGGDQASKYRVAVLTSRMSRAEILAAQQQANDWLRNHQMAGNATPSR